MEHRAVDLDMLRGDEDRIVNAWPANTGAAPNGLIQIGDNAAKTFTLNFDNVRLDQAAG